MGDGHLETDGGRAISSPLLQPTLKASGDHHSAFQISFRLIQIISNLCLNEPSVNHPVASSYKTLLFFGSACGFKSKSHILMTTNVILH